ncbi:MAG TPA: hypothetical protein PLY73_09185, partial [Candidatus Ozemobacteraceae bacterium]|nr:hypothetical protein [Candidatus Ozemobacteraceae bacterium]
MLHRKTTVAILVLLTGIFAGPLAASPESARAVTDRYRSAYQAYRTAIEKGASVEDLRKYLDDYISAKAAYEKAVAPARTPATAVAANTGDAPIATNLDSSAESGAFAAAGHDSEPPTASCPAELQKTVEELREGKNRDKAEEYMAELQAYIEKHPGTSSAGYAKYELARAYETIKNDPIRAAELYAEIAGDPESTILAALAKRRLSYLQAQAEQPKWRQYLSDKFRKMEETYTKYVRTSWLAFPVKITRFFEYLGKFGSFKKAQSDESDFQLRFEAIAAPFVGTVDQVFEEIAVSGESRDDEGLVRLLNLNTESWFARWKLLSEARESIDVQYFIIDTDVFGMAM